MECDIGSEGALSLLEDSGEFSLYMISHNRGEKTVAREGVFDSVFQKRAVIGIVKKMGMRPAGKWAFFLDIPEHFTRLVFDMTGMKVEREGACVHFQFYMAPGTYFSLIEDNSVSFPGREEAFQSSRSAVI